MSDSEEPRDEASQDASKIDGPEATEEAESEFRPFDEVDEEFQPGPDQRVMGPDGLPVTVDGTGPTDIPSLSTKTLVCMGDFSKFVLRNHWGEVVGLFEPELVERSPYGRWRIAMTVVLEMMKLRIEMERKKLAGLRKQFQAKELSGAAQLGDMTDVEVLSAMLAKPGEFHGFDAFWVDVEPIRPPCKHYVRQKTSFSLNAQHNVYIRLCSARRTTEGTFMSVRDTGMYACDMRDPFDAESVGQLDEFDRLKIEQGKQVQHLPMVGGSIFDSK
jgi:hypothetical protein